MKKSELKYIIQEAFYKRKSLKEEIEGNKLFIYHRTKTNNAKVIIKGGGKLNIGEGGLLGPGIYAVYDQPSNIKSSLDSYGGVSLRYSISKSSLSDLLIFDKELQIKSLEEQLKPFKEQIDRVYTNYIIQDNKRIKNEKDTSSSKHMNYSKDNYDKQQKQIESNYSLFNDSIVKYNEGKLKQLDFLETLNDIGFKWNKYFDGILYSVKGNASGGGFSGGISRGTNKTIVIYDSSLLTYEGYSTDGLNYKKAEEGETTKIQSPEVQLVKGLVKDGSIIKKGYVNLKGKKITKLPNNLTIDGSLDLRDISLSELPKNLTVNQSLYINGDKVKDIPDDWKIKKFSPYDITDDIKNSLEKKGWKYKVSSYDKLHNGYFGYFYK